MIKGLLLRGPSTNQGTAGWLYLNNMQCRIMELPDRNNAPQISRIPAGTYVCKWQKSPKFGWCYQVMGVPNRSRILIHAGNYTGDVAAGYKSHSHGCILPCTSVGRINGQMAGLISKPAVRKIAEVMKQQPFQLEIRDA